MPGTHKEKIGPYELAHPKDFPAITEDPFHLVDFLLKSDYIGSVSSAIDIGTATGVIPLLLAAKSDIGRITGVEIDPDQAKCAKLNIERNSLKERVEIVNKDFRELADMDGSFDLVISNPPYIKAGSGRESNNEKRVVARSEKFGSLTELISVSRRLLSERGRLFLIFPILRKNELLSELVSNGFHIAREELVRGKQSSEARLFMIEAGADGTL